MGWMEQLDRNTDQMRTMASTIGLDLDAAVARGIIPAEALRGAMLRCGGCERPGACAVWLDKADGAAEAPPGWCANSILMMTAKREGAGA